MTGLTSHVGDRSMLHAGGTGKARHPLHISAEGQTDSDISHDNQFAISLYSYSRQSHDAAGSLVASVSFAPL